jgi:PASTA domain-containing protein
LSGYPDGMADDSWVEGRQAWSRLSEWIRLDDRDGDGALRALGDVGLVRRLLDRAEFEAVRDARQQGRSWSEIAVRLGVTRQSAWERWRDIDDDAPAEHDPAGDAATELTVQARDRRRKSSVTVPNVVGMSWSDARQLLRVNRLVGIDADPDTLALMTGTRDGAVVVDQSPESGAKVPPGSSVKLWVRKGGGGSGVREPRRPVPDPLQGAKHRDELTDEAV